MHKWRERNQDELFKPIIKPKFKIPRNAKFFMFGSCFARYLEWELHNSGHKVLSIPRAKMPLDTNRYHLSSILQGLRSSVPNTKESFVELAPSCWGDPYQQTPRNEMHSLEELMERRKEVDALTSRVHTADAVIITMGLTETWYDFRLDLHAFRNLKNDERFCFCNYSQDWASADVEAIIEELGDKDIILTVSPVPLNATFSDLDVVTANTYSKAVLRAVAQDAAAEYPNVDYFPAYEMVLHSKDPWQEDGRHVKKNVVAHVMQQFVEHYIEKEK